MDGELVTNGALMLLVLDRFINVVRVMRSGAAPKNGEIKDTLCSVHKVAENTKSMVSLMAEHVRTSDRDHDRILDRLDRINK